MLTPDIVKDLLDKRWTLPKEWKEKIKIWRGVYYRMSLHIDGACPSFYSLRYNVSTQLWMRDKQTLPNNYFGVEYQAIFDLYLFSAHPREPEVIREWRMSQYKPYTQAPFLQVIDVITGSVFQDSGWVVKVEDKEDDEYIHGNNFCEKDLISYLSSKFTNVASDPNGYFIVIPTKQRNEYEAGEDITVKIPYIFTKHIHFMSEDEIVFEYEGYHWWITKEGYFRYQKQDKVWVNVDGENDGYFAHMMGYLPIVIGGGRQNAQGFIDSWLSAARAAADEFVGAKSALQLVNKESSHPYIIEADVVCPDCAGICTKETDCGCVTGCDRCANRGTISTSCPSCKGVGRISRNPGQRMIVPPSDMANDMIKIVNPEISINEFHLKQVDELRKDMLKALHLDGIDQAQSGTAKTIDLQTRYQFLISISNDWFTRIIPNILRIILSLRHTGGADGIETDNPFNIIPPTEFDIKNGLDLMTEYDIATKSGFPTFVREQINLAAVDKLFGGDPILKRKAYIITAMDFLCVCTPDEIQLWLLNGAAKTKDAQFHVMLPNIIDNIIREKGADAFMDMTDDAIIAEVNTRFNKIAPSAPEVRDVTERVDV